MTSRLVPVLCLVAMTALAIGVATACVEMATWPSPLLSPPRPDSLKQELGDRDNGLTGSVITDDYGRWGPTPDTRGGVAAPIPPLEAAISDAANSRPHDRPES
ncbi:hypothetical protein NL676_025135 [Syzygium grande]|nr:hypothetical protein NL676_025135 [Syzygium grande]